MNKNRFRVEKVGSIALALVALGGAFQPARADDPTVPTLVSFTLSPNSIEVTSNEPAISLDLVVHNSAGIYTTQTLITLTDGASNKVLIPIARTDSPINPGLETVEFKGTYRATSSLPAGVYRATSAPIYGLTSTGAQGFATQPFTATSTASLVGATNGILIRNGGDLNFAYSTFTGPTFNTLTPHIFTNPKYSSTALPIWKVGETFNPSDYYEINVPSLSLKAKATTPTVCTSDGTKIKLIAVGDCSFIVYTDKTMDYQYKEDTEIVSVTAARTKPTFSVGTISTQSSSTLPLSIPGPLVYSPFGLVTPVSATPAVCYPVGSYVTIISGGTCTLNYSTPESPSYLASDVVPLTFQITRAAQTLNFTVPTSLPISVKNFVLNATASSGGLVTFESETPVICSVTGNSLKLLQAGSCQLKALQAGSGTISPVSVTQSIALLTNSPTVGRDIAVKKVVCTRNGKSKTYKGTKCPAGYKMKK